MPEGLSREATAEVRGMWDDVYYHYSLREMLVSKRENQGLIDIQLVPLSTPAPTSSPVIQSLPDGSGDIGLSNSVDSGVWTGTTAESSETLRGAICSYFDASPYGCNYWICLAGKESSMRPGADNNPPYIGLFQIDIDLHAGLISSLGYTTADMYTASPNSHVAWSLSHQGVYTVPWPVARWLC